MFLYYLLIVLFLHISYATENVYKTYKNYKIFEVEGDEISLEKMIKFLTKNYEIPFHMTRETKSQLLVAPELVTVIEKFVKTEKLHSKIVIEDYSEIIRLEKLNNSRTKGFSWTAYYDVDDIYKYLQNVSTAYSSHAQLVVGGHTYEGRQILGIRINTPTRNIKPVMFIESGIHAREWITPATITYFINELLTSNNPEIIQLRNQFDWHIFPTVNPDGYHYSFNFDRMWRKTRSKTSQSCYGADPNRNWDYNWMTSCKNQEVDFGNTDTDTEVLFQLKYVVVSSNVIKIGQVKLKIQPDLRLCSRYYDYGSSSDPCDYQVYAGSRPFSEIETKTLAEYVSGLDNLLGYVGFHSDAQTLLLPYSDSTEHVDNYDDLKKIGETSLRYGYSVNSEKYDGPGTAAEILYKVSGGSMDWVRHSLGTPLVYTYELRGTYFYWPPNRIYEQGDEVTQMMLGLATEARNLGYF